MLQYWTKPSYALLLQAMSSNNCIEAEDSMVAILDPLPCNN